MRDRLNKMMGRTRFVVCRLFLHLEGQEIATILKLLNRIAVEAIDADGDLEVLSEGLVEICQTLLQYDECWLSAANEGDIFWDEGEAGDYVNELFTDSATRYLSETDNTSIPGFVSATVTRNLIVMITVAYEGEVPDLETDLSNIPALKAGLKALINLHYKSKYRAIQVHFSPAQLGDELTYQNLSKYYPELIALDPNQSIRQYYPDLVSPIKDQTKEKPSIKPMVFLASDKKDESLANELGKHITLLKTYGEIKKLDDNHQISAGTQWESEIDRRLQEADIILLLTSVDFLTSEDCLSIMEKAIEQYQNRAAKLIPVILRAVYWEGSPLGKFKPLPKNNLPVTSTNWENRDVALMNVTEGIREIVKELNSNL
jgi:Protein of unknown function (DUF1517)/TIR domain